MDEFITNFFDIIQNKYAAFEGRARRKEYWQFVAVNLCVSVVGSMLGRLPLVGWIIQVAVGLYGLAVLVPGIAVAIRRMHDINKSGWVLLLAFIPLVGAIIVIVFAATEGTVGDNAYGPDPKADER